VDFSHAFPESRVDRVRSVSGVARADNLIVSFLNIDLPSGSQESVITYALEDFERWGIPWGSWEGNLSDLRRGDYLFLDQSAAKRFGPFALGDYREVNRERLRIIGRTRGAKSFTTTPMAFLDFRLAQRLNAQTLRGNTTYILVKIAPGADAPSVAAEIRRRLPFNDVHTRSEWAARSRRYWVANTGLGFNLFITVFLGCLVGVVVVAQTLYTSTMEHLKEFGTVKAIGGTNRDIYAILARQAGVSLDLHRGEVVALEGPSGSGKTTLLSILGCILTATRGELTVDGMRIDPARPALLPAVRRKSIGFVFQQFNLFPALTAVENVE